MGCGQSKDAAGRIVPNNAHGQPTFLLAPAARERRFADIYDPLPAKPLGSGSFGKVFVAREVGGGGEVAVKIMPVKANSRQVIEAELRVLHICHGHAHIVQQLDVFETTAEVSLVLELMHGGELFDALARSGPYSEDDAVAPVRGMCGALAFLHARGIAHRDLKPQNLLLSHGLGPSATLKICDFGLAKQCAPPLSTVELAQVACPPRLPFREPAVQQPQPLDAARPAALCLSPESQHRLSTVTMMNKPCGTWPYMAPEVLRILHGAPGEYSQAVDMFAAGIIMFVVLSGYHPYDPDGVNSPRRMQALMLRGAWSFDDWRHGSGAHVDGGGGAWALVSSAAKQLITAMLEVDPVRRISAQEALDHSWTKGAATVEELGLPEGLSSGRLSATIDRDIGTFKGRMRGKLKAAAVATTAAMTFKRRGSESAALRIRQLSLVSRRGGSRAGSLAEALVAEEHDGDDEDDDEQKSEQNAGVESVAAASVAAVTTVAAAAATVAGAAKPKLAATGPPAAARPSLLRASSAMGDVLTNRSRCERCSLPGKGTSGRVHTDPGPDGMLNSVGLLLRRRAYFTKFSRKRTSSNSSAGSAGHARSTLSSVAAAELDQFDHARRQNDTSRHK